MIPKRFWWNAPPSPGTPGSSPPSSIQNEKDDKALQQKRLDARKRKRLLGIGIGAMVALLGLILGLSLGLTLGRKHKHDNDSDGPVINLDYTSYRGNNLQNGVNEWLGMRYAAAPIGELRFAAPQDPLRNDTVQKANKACLESYACVQITNSPTAWSYLSRYS